MILLLQGDNRMNEVKWLNKQLKRNKMSVQTLSDLSGIDVYTILFYCKGKVEMTEEHKVILKQILNQPFYQDNILEKRYRPKSVTGILSVKKLTGKKKFILSDLRSAIHTVFKTYLPIAKPMLIFLIVTLGLAYLTDQFATENLLYSAIIPITLLVLVFLSTTEKPFSVMDILKFVVYGGLLSILIVISVRGIVGYPEGLLGEYLTGFLEEFAKILIVILLLKKFKIITVKSGLLVGFAVGAGFDLFETADYGFMVFIENLDYGEMYGVLTARNLYAVLGIGHHFWTALLAGTLVYINKEEKLHFKLLFKPVFIQMFIIVVSLHAFWNYSSGLNHSGDAIIGYIIMLIVMIVSTWMFLKLFQVAHYEERFNEHVIKVNIKSIPVPEQVSLDQEENSLS
jgi:RsiW-degrading membrane proteinase PrsW (M82 family)